MPGTLYAQPPGIVATNLSCVIQVVPPSSDLSNMSPGPLAQATYTSPFGPTAGTAPSNVLSSSRQSPPCASSRTGSVHVVPPSMDFTKRMCELSPGSALSYLSNCVQ